MEGRMSENWRRRWRERGESEENDDEGLLGFRKWHQLIMTMVIGKVMLRNKTMLFVSSTSNSEGIAIGLFNHPVP